MWRRVWQEIKDILFPIFCIDCGQEGEWWCENCRYKDKTNPIITGADGELDFTAALFNYAEDNQIGRLIKQFKYHFAYDLETLWQKIFLESDLNKIIFNNFLGQPFTIMPVPLHRRRLSERGFNQSEILAKIIFAQLKNIRPGITLDQTNLIRINYTKKQASLSKIAREQNIIDAFIWAGQIAPENIILVDDVFTTGSTLRECAKVLKQAGAKKVMAITLARGQFIYDAKSR